MTKTLLISTLLLISAHAIGQDPANTNTSIEAYKTIPGLELKTSVHTKDIIGIFQFQVGSYQWLYLTLDSNMTYTIRSRDCLTGALFDTGSWSISFNRILTLQSSTKRKIFDVLQTDCKLYLVEPIKRVEFIKQIKHKTFLELNFFSKNVN